MKSVGSPLNYFKNKKVIVTGGSSGIGKAIAHGLLKIEAEVTIVSDRADSLRLTSEEFKADSLHVNTLQCDLANSQEISNLFDRVSSDDNIPDIIINNAGYAVYRTFEQSSPGEIERLIQVNLLGAMSLTRYFLPEFIRRRSGTIVNMASIAGTMAITPNGTYCSAKHALVAWSECLRYEISRFNINVNVICPGRVLTPFFDHETFQLRSARPETSSTLPLAVVVEGTLNAIMKNRFITYMPKTLGFLSWVKSAFPFIINPIYQKLMHSRIKSIYE